MKRLLSLRSVRSGTRGHHRYRPVRMTRSPGISIKLVTTTVQVCLSKNPEVHRTNPRRHYRRPVGTPVQEFRDSPHVSWTLQSSPPSVYEPEGTLCTPVIVVTVILSVRSHCGYYGVSGSVVYVYSRSPPSSSSSESFE